MTTLDDKVEAVNNKETFILFLQALIEDYRDNSQHWENKTLSTFLDAMQSWIEDMEGFYNNNNLPVPKKIDWKVFATILTAARVYE